MKIFRTSNKVRFSQKLIAETDQEKPKSLSWTRDYFRFKAHTNENEISFYVELSREELQEALRKMNREQR